jgi:hypothetical protein
VSGILLLGAVALLVAAGPGGSPASHLSAGEATAAKSALENAIADEQDALKALDRRNSLDAEIEIGRSVRALKPQPAVFREAGLPAASEVPADFSAAIFADGSAVYALESDHASEAARIATARTFLESALRAKESALKDVSAGGGTGSENGASDECKAAPGQLCTIDPAEPTVTVDAPGSGFVEVGDTRTGTAKAHAAPGVFTIKTDPGDFLDLLNGSSKTATIGGSATTPSGTTGTESVRSCIDVLGTSTGHVAEVTVTDTAAAKDPATITFTTPAGFTKTVAITLSSTGVGVESLAVPAASEVEITVTVKTSPPQTETLTAKEDGQLHCTNPGTTPSGSSTLPPVSSAPTSAVIIAGHELGWNAKTTPDICNGGTLTLTLTLEGIPASTKVVLELTGPGVQGPLTLTLDPGFQVSYDFRVPPSSGTTTWTSQIVSIGGKPPPSSGAHAGAYAQCPTR